MVRTFSNGHAASFEQIGDAQLDPAGIRDDSSSFLAMRRQCAIAGVERTSRKCRLAG